MSEMTHYRKVFDSPYLSAADIFEPVVLTVARVTQETDKTKKSKDVFNTAYFQEREIRPGEKLKPMILNATNSKMMDRIAGSPFIEDWSGKRITVYVDSNVKFGRETVEGLRIRAAAERRMLTPESASVWANAKEAYRRDGNLDKVLSRFDMSQEHIDQIKAECVAQESTNEVD